jgi:hypothetical protein
MSIKYKIVQREVKIPSAWDSWQRPRLCDTDKRVRYMDPFFRIS